MLLLTRRDVEAVLDIPACAAAMVDALSGLARGALQQPPRSQFIPHGAPARMGLMPAYRSQGRPVFGLKSVLVNAGNAARGLDTHQGVVLLHDGEDGRVLAVIDATAITEIRTAAVSAVATRTLARPDSAIVAILGTGTQARAHVHAMRHVFPRAEIRIWGRDRPRAEALAEGLRACSTIIASDRGVEQALSLCFKRQLCRRADAVICQRCLSVGRCIRDTLVNARAG